MEICSNCHPFYTGKQRLIDTAGRIDRFRKKYAKFEDKKGLTMFCRRRDKRRFIPSLISLFRLLAPASQVGGQAVMEGVMMRCKSRLAIAVRKPDGSILVETRPLVQPD